jgi:hypothetical protein
LTETRLQVLGLILVIDWSFLFGNARIWGLGPPPTRALSIDEVCGTSEYTSREREPDFSCILEHLEIAKTWWLRENFELFVGVCTPFGTFRGSLHAHLPLECTHPLENSNTFELVEIIAKMYPSLSTSHVTHTQSYPLRVLPLKSKIFNFRPKKCQIPNLHQFGSYKKPYKYKKLEEKKLVILGPRGHYVRPPWPVRSTHFLVGAFSRVIGPGVHVSCET